MLYMVVPYGPSIMRTRFVLLQAHEAVMARDPSESITRFCDDRFHIYRPHTHRLDQVEQGERLYCRVVREPGGK